MVSSRMFCALFATTLVFCVGCSGSDDDKTDQANQSVGTRTTTNAGAVEDDGGEGVEPEDPCALPGALHNPQCQRNDGTRPLHPAPAPY